MLVAIYLTLGLASTLAGELRDRGLIEASFWLGLLLVGAAIAFLGLKTGPSGPNGRCRARRRWRIPHRVPPNDEPGGAHPLD